MVAWEPALPGTEISTEGKVLAVLDTAPMPSRKAMAGYGSRVMAKGRTMVMSSSTPMPGRAAKNELPTMPITIRNIGHGLRISEMAVRRASTMGPQNKGRRARRPAGRCGR